MLIKEKEELLNELEVFKSNKEIKKLEKITTHMNVVPELFSQDELMYYIKSLVGLKVTLEDGSEKVFKLYEENLIEMIGLELEIDLEDYLDFDTEKAEYIKAKEELEELYSKVA